MIYTSIFQPLHLYVCMCFFLLLGCQGPSYEDFRAKGRSKTRSLIADLKTVRTKDQLIEKKDKLGRHFKELAELARQVEGYQKKSEEKIPPLGTEDLELSDRLRTEILRIYRLEGGKEIIDACRDL